MCSQSHYVFTYKIDVFLRQMSISKTKLMSNLLRGVFLSTDRYYRSE